MSLNGVGNAHNQVPHDEADRLASLGARAPAAGVHYAIAQASFHGSTTSIKLLTGYMPAMEAYGEVNRLKRFMSERAERLNSLKSFADMRMKHAKRYGTIHQEFVILEQGSNYGRGDLYNSDGYKLDDRGNITEHRLDLAPQSEPKIDIATRRLGAALLQIATNYP
jgi:hypothetical protein